MTSQWKGNSLATEEIKISQVDSSNFEQLRELYEITWRATYTDIIGSDVVAQLSEPSVGGMVPSDAQVFGAFSENGELIGAAIVREVG